MTTCLSIFIYLFYIYIKLIKMIKLNSIRLDIDDDGSGGGGGGGGVGFEEMRTNAQGFCFQLMESLTMMMWIMKEDGRGTSNLQ